MEPQKGVVTFLIPVPWGHIAAKAHGEPTSIPVILIHGIQDNAGSYDLLIPLLPQGFYYVCIDLPGHGLSSHFPAGLPLEFFNYVSAVKRVVDYLKWDALILIGHSLGGQIISFFASLYSEKVIKIALIDGFTPPIVPVSETATFHRNRIQDIIDLEKRLSARNPPGYTYTEALERLATNRLSPLTTRAAEVLMRRSVSKWENGYRFVTDQRLKFTFNPPLTFEQQQCLFEQIQCPVLYIVAKETYDSQKKNLSQQKMIKLLKVIPAFTFHIVEGNHNVHLNQPDHVAKILNPFVIRQRSSL